MPVCLGIHIFDIENRKQCHLRAKRADLSSSAAVADKEQGEENIALVSHITHMTFRYQIVCNLCILPQVLASNKEVEDIVNPSVKVAEQKLGHRLQLQYGVGYRSVDFPLDQEGFNYRGRKNGEKKRINNRFFFFSFRFMLYLIVSIMLLLPNFGTMVS